MAFIYNKDEKGTKKALDIQLEEINDGLSRPIEIKSTKISKTFPKILQSASAGDAKSKQLEGVCLM